MANEIIVALISCAGSVLVGSFTLAGVFVQNRRHNKEISELIEYRVSKLEEKQDKYNNFQERLITLEVAFSIFSKGTVSGESILKTIQKIKEDGYERK